MSAKGYIVAEVKASHPEALAHYRELSTAAVAQYGGRFLVRGGTAEILEGKWTPPQRMVIVEFDSVEQARRFYDSPEYRAAREARKDAAEMQMLVISGVEFQL